MNEEKSSESTDNGKSSETNEQTTVSPQKSTRVVSTPCEVCGQPLKPSRSKYGYHHGECAVAWVEREKRKGRKDL